MVSPSSQNWNSLIVVYSACTLFLYLKYFFCQMYGVDYEAHPPEDAKLLEGKTQVHSPEDLKRRKRMFANDLENLPIHLTVFWAAFIVQNFANASGNGKNETTALILLFILYTFFRTFFTVFYAFQIQPLRSIVFILANLMVIAAGIVMVISSSYVDVNKVFM